MTPNCIYCDERPGVHTLVMHTPQFNVHTGKPMLVKTVEHVCTLCLHEESWFTSHRLTFVPGQGWTI